MIVDFSSFNNKVYSQNGEDGIIEKIIDLIGIDIKYFVEIGVGDGEQCNFRNLYKNKSWNGIFLDKEETSNINVFTENITSENVNDIFKKHKVPKKFGMLSIDMDGIDYYVWEAIKYDYDVLVIEYNASHPPHVDWKVAYNPDFVWKRNNHFGASLLSLYNLGKEKNYELVCCDNSGTNAFFVKKEKLPKNMLLPEVQNIFRKHRIWSKF